MFFVKRWGHFENLHFRNDHYYYYYCKMKPSRKISFLCLHNDSGTKAKLNESLVTEISVNIAKTKQSQTDLCHCKYSVTKQSSVSANILWQNKALSLQIFCDKTKLCLCKYSVTKQSKQISVTANIATKKKKRGGGQTNLLQNKAKQSSVTANILWQNKTKQISVTAKH